MRRAFITGLLVTLGMLPGSTLRQLSLDDMIRQSTMIVHGTVQPANISYHGSMIFSHYTVQVTETYKGPASTSGPVDFGVPGGSLNGTIQRVAGAPILTVGQDYVLFLWTSKSGLTQVIGLSQGLLSVITTPGAAPMVLRPAAAAGALSATGQPVTTNDISMSLSALKAEISNVLSGQSTR